MKYDMKHVASVPEIKNQPAYAGDIIDYIAAVVAVAASEGAAAAPPGARARLVVRPESESAWLVFQAVDDLTRADIENAFDACIGDPGEDRMEVDVKWLTDAEDDALPEFDGW